METIETTQEQTEEKQRSSRSNDDAVSNAKSLLIMSYC